MVEAWPAGRKRKEEEGLGELSCKRQKEVGGFIHQQDCILLGGVVREEGPDPMLEEGRTELFLESSPHSGHLLHSCHSTLPKRMHVFIHFFISHALHTYGVPGTVLGTEEATMMKITCKSHPFLPWLKSLTGFLFILEERLHSLACHSGFLMFWLLTPSPAPLPVTSGNKHTEFFAYQ